MPEPRRAITYPSNICVLVVAFNHADVHFDRVTRAEFGMVGSADLLDRCCA